MSHFALGIKYRTWFFSTVFVLGGIGTRLSPHSPLFLSSPSYLLLLGETIGYIGRTGSAYDVTLNNYFIMQIVCLIISPAFFSAGLYLTIGNLYTLSDYVH
jgi:RTA1 like protein